MWHLKQIPKAHCRRITIGLLLVSLMQIAIAQEPIRITGTYSDMYYNKEAGDVVGEEMRIVATAAGYQGVLQFAEGVPSDLIVVDVKLDGNKVSFSIPGSSVYAGPFAGTLDNGVLRGELRFKSGTTEVIRLPRRKSYWD